MMKPKPRNKFASDDDEREHILDCLCWLVAKDMSLDLDRSQEDCADYLKQEVVVGRLVVDYDSVGDRVRLVPAPSLAEH